jgi:hypothetical protein
MKSLLKKESMRMDFVQNTDLAILFHRSIIPVPSITKHPPIFFLEYLFKELIATTIVQKKKKKNVQMTFQKSNTIISSLSVFLSVLLACCHTNPIQLQLISFNNFGWQ